MQENIAVIVPAKAMPQKLKECIGSILNLGYPDLEVIVVDDGLEKEALGVLDSFKGRVKVLKSDSCGPSAARNLAARYTAKEYIAFTDSDCIVDRGWLEELTRGFREYPQAAACGGIQKLPEDSTGFEKKVFLFMRKAGLITDYIRKAKHSRIYEVNHNPSCNVMYRREIYLKEGGFLEGLWPGEDVEFDYRLKKKGYKLFFNPDAVVYHYKPKTWNSFLRMMYRYGFTQGALVTKYGMFRRIHYFPILSLMFLFLFLLLMFVGKAFALWFIFGVLFFSWFYFLNYFSFILFVSGSLSWNLGFMAGFIKRNI